MPPSSRRRRRRRSRNRFKFRRDPRKLPSSVAELIVLLIVGLAPWAFGSVDAAALLAIEVGVAIAAFRVFFKNAQEPPVRPLVCAVSYGLLGLTLLAGVQSLDMPRGVLRLLDGTTAASWADSAPDEPETVKGDPNKEPVAAPRSTLSHDPTATQQRFFRYLSAWVLFQTVYSMSGSFSRLRRVGSLLAVNAAMLAFFTIIQNSTWNGKVFWIRPTHIVEPWNSGGPFALHNHLADALNFGLGFSLCKLLWRPAPSTKKTPDRGRSLWAATMTALSGAGLLLSQSRGGFVAFALGALVVLGLGARNIRLRSSAAVTLGLVAVFVALLGVAPVRSRLSSVLDMADKGYTVRFEIWDLAVRSGLDHPVWGLGLDAFGVGSLPYFQVDHGNFYLRSENEYVNLWAEGGLVGCLLGGWMLGSLAWTALRATWRAPRGSPRAAVAGTVIGLLALAIHSTGDFGVQVPGVGVIAIVLAALLCRVSFYEKNQPLPEGELEPVTTPTPSTESSESADAASQPQSAPNADLAAAPTPPWGRHRWLNLAVALAALPPIVDSAVQTVLEYRLTQGKVPLPGEFMPTISYRIGSRATLDRTRQALERAVALRPSWPEGHLRLAMTHLSLYMTMTSGWLQEQGTPEEDLVRLSDPLSLHRSVHEAETPINVSELLAYDPVRIHLVPAARELLEARRGSPDLGAVQAMLGGLDYLLVKGDPAPVYAQRALRVAGASKPVLLVAARVALQARDLKTAAACWRRLMVVNRAEDVWADIADAAAATLSPDQIRDELAPNAEALLFIAQRCFRRQDQRKDLEMLLDTVIARAQAEREAGRPAAERLALQARAAHDLGDSAHAREWMDQALALIPIQVDWLVLYSGWLIEWGDPVMAREHAITAVTLRPDDPEVQKALERAHEAFAIDAPPDPSLLQIEKPNG